MPRKSKRSSRIRKKKSSRIKVGGAGKNHGFFSFSINKLNPSGPPPNIGLVPYKEKFDLLNEYYRLNLDNLPEENKSMIIDLLDEHITDIRNTFHTDDIRIKFEKYFIELQFTTNMSEDDIISKSNDLRNSWNSPPVPIEFEYNGLYYSIRYLNSKRQFSMFW